MLKRNPCISCDNRYAECHTSCKAYANWKWHLDRENELRRKQIDENNIIMESAVEKKYKKWKKDQ